MIRRVQSARARNRFHPQLRARGLTFPSPVLTLVSDLEEPLMRRLASPSFVHAASAALALTLFGCADANPGGGVGMPPPADLAVCEAVCMGGCDDDSSC